MNIKSLTTQFFVLAGIISALIATPIILQNDASLKEAVLILITFFSLSILKVLVVMRLIHSQSSTTKSYSWIAITGVFAGLIECGIVGWLSLQATFELIVISEMLTGMFLCYWYHSNLEAMQELRRNMLYRLTQQMHHHFLFNTLNTTVCLIDDFPEKAQDNLINLSHLYRVMMNQKEISSMQEEIDVSKSYIAIEKKRLGTRLNVAWKIDCKNASAIGMPSLFLQPLVENAIRHGVESFTDKQGDVEIRIQLREDQTILFEVTNPIGSCISTSPNQKTHSNLYKRLALYYGEKNFEFVAKREATRYITKTIIPSGGNYEFAIS